MERHVREGWKGGTREAGGRSVGVMLCDVCCKSSALRAMLCIKSWAVWTNDDALQVVRSWRDPVDWLVRAGEMSPERTRCKECNVPWAVSLPTVLDLASERQVFWRAPRVIRNKSEVDNRNQYVCGIWNWRWNKWLKQLKRREEIERVGLNGVGNRLGRVCQAGLELMWIIGGGDNVLGRDDLRWERGCG